MALLKTCILHRSVNILAHYHPIPSYFYNSQLLENKRVIFECSRRNSSSDTWRDSYNNFFKSVTESDAVATVKDGLVFVHDFSGLPWGWTIFVATFGLRALITFPLGIYQSFVLAKFEIVKLEFNETVRELKRETAVAVKRYGLNEKDARSLYNASLKKQWRLIIERENCHPLKAGLIVLIQLPMWILMSLAYRCMAFKLGQDPIKSNVIADQLSVEGIGWVSNLLVPDPICVLPLSVSLINLCIIELQAATKENPTRAQRIVTNVLRAFALVSFPIAMTVPSCMSLYWCVSSGLALGQNIALMSPKLRELAKIPITPSYQGEPYQNAWNNFKKKWTILSKFSKK